MSLQKARETNDLSKYVQGASHIRSYVSGGIRRYNPTIDFQQTTQLIKKYLFTIIGSFPVKVSENSLG